MKPLREAGQSMVETLVAAALLTSLVAIPVGGHSSALAFLLWAVRTAFAKFLGAISLPL